MVNFVSAMMMDKQMTVGNETLLSNSLNNNTEVKTLSSSFMNLLSSLLGNHELEQGEDGILSLPLSEEEIMLQLQDLITALIEHSDEDLSMLDMEQVFGMLIGQSQLAHLSMAAVRNQQQTVTGSNFQAIGYDKTLLQQYLSLPLGNTVTAEPLHVLTVDTISKFILHQYRNNEVASQTNAPLAEELNAQQNEVSTWGHRMLQALEAWNNNRDTESLQRLLTVLKENQTFYGNLETKFTALIQERLQHVKNNYQEKLIGNDPFSAQEESSGTSLHLSMSGHHANTEQSLRVHGGGRVQAEWSTMQMNSESFVKDFSQFIVKKLDVTQWNGISEAKIRLVPEHLGQLDIKLTMQGGHLTAMFASDNITAKEMLELQLPLLRQALQMQGFQVQRLEVTYQTSQFDHGQHTHSGYSQSSGHSFSSQQDANGSEKYSNLEIPYEEDLIYDNSELLTSVSLSSGRSFDTSA